MGRKAGTARESATGRSDAAQSGRPTTKPLQDAAAEVGMRQVFATLGAIIRPWKRLFAVVVASGVGRVAAFIGVSPGSDESRVGRGCVSTVRSRRSPYP